MNKLTKSIIGVIFGLIFLIGTGIVAASPSTTQDNPLYPFKVALEKVKLATTSTEDKAVVQVELLNNRADELELLKTKIAQLEQNQQSEKAAEAKKAALETELAAKKTAAQAKADAQLITDKTKKSAILNNLKSSEARLDDEEDEDEEIEAQEPEEAPEPTEEEEIEEQRDEDEKEDESNDED